MTLACAGTESGTVIGGGSPAGKRQMLEMLSERLLPGTRLEAAVQQVTQSVGRGQDLLVISPRSLKDAVPTQRT